MRKMILISAFVPASVSAEAGQSRGLVLAANDEVKMAEAAAPRQATTTAPAKPDAAKPEASSTPSSKSPKKTQARRHETDEQKARRIARNTASTGDAPFLHHRGDVPRGRSLKILAEDQ
jgi:hypothetical protein